MSGADTETNSLALGPLSVSRPLAMAPATSTEPTDALFNRPENSYRKTARLFVCYVVGGTKTAGNNSAKTARLPEAYARWK